MLIGAIAVPMCACGSDVLRSFAFCMESDVFAVVQINLCNL
jgi:hypothetical protein